MARKSNTRAAQGAGTIRKKAVTRKGVPLTPIGRPASRRATIPALAGRFNGPSRAEPKKRYAKKCRPRL